LEHGDSAERVDLEDAANAGHRRGQQLIGVIERRIVDCGIECAERRDASVDHGMCGVGIGDVGGIETGALTQRSR
jgi:hypothetical protein